jgi:hypothetical protein
LLLRTAASTDTHNRPTYTYEEQTAVSCGVRLARNVEAADSEGNVVLVDFQVRLPHGTAVTANDRFEILTRYGAPDAPAVVCEIVGAIEHGPTAVLIQCKELTHGRER